MWADMFEFRSASLEIRERKKKKKEEEEEEDRRIRSKI